MSGFFVVFVDFGSSSFIYCSFFARPKNEPKKGGLRSFLGLTFSQKISEGIDRLTAICVDISNNFKTVAFSQNSLRPFEIQKQ
jgi:hypothetical protein